MHNATKGGKINQNVNNDNLIIERGLIFIFRAASRRLMKNRLEIELRNFRKTVGK